jgi:hypothetical protein
MDLTCASATFQGETHRSSHAKTKKEAEHNICEQIIRKLPPEEPVIQETSNARMWFNEYQQKKKLPSAQPAVTMTGSPPSFVASSY